MFFIKIRAAAVLPCRAPSDELQIVTAKGGRKKTESMDLLWGVMVPKRSRL